MFFVVFSYVFKISDKREKNFHASDSSKSAVFGQKPPENAFPKIHKLKHEVTKHANHIA